MYTIEHTYVAARTIYNISSLVQSELEYELDNHKLSYCLIQMLETLYTQTLIAVLIRDDHKLEIAGPFHTLSL